MGNRNPRPENSISGQQQSIVQGQQGVASQSAQSRGLFRGFGRSTTGTGVKSSYATTVNQHLILGQPTQYSLQNADSILGRNISSKYPRGEGQIYNIKQYNATYQGPFNKGFPHGKGVAYFKDGGYYSGDFVDGDANGYGLYIYPNGSIYEGQFSNSVYNGQGTLVYADRRLRYDGNFVNGLPEGQGRETYADGSSYQGEFYKGQKHGQGIYQWANGQRYEGSFADGLMHGKGVLGDSQGVIFQGDFVRGLKNGYGVYRTQQGTYEGNFDKDLLNGNGSFIWNDGKVYEGNFVNSMMHGQGTMYYPSNQIAQGQWENNHNKSLLAVRNDSSAAERIRQIRSRHQLGSRISGGNINRNISNQSSMRRDESYHQDSNRDHNSDQYNSGFILNQNPHSSVYKPSISNSGVGVQPSVNSYATYNNPNDTTRYVQYG